MARSIEAFVTKKAASHFGIPFVHWVQIGINMLRLLVQEGFAKRVFRIAEKRQKSILKKKSQKDLPETVMVTQEIPVLTFAGLTLKYSSCKQDIKTSQP